MFETLRKLIEKLKGFLAKKFHQYNQKLPYYISLIFALIVFGGSIKLFVELTESLKTDLLANFDLVVSQKIISYRNPSLTNFFTFVTNVGDLYGYLFVLAICVLVFYLIFKNWNYVVQLVFVLILSTISNLILKHFINRSRPVSEHLVTVETLSYPSGHSMTAMAFYGFLVYLFFNLKMNKFLKLTTIILFMMLILSIGISRIYLGVHFPSDIIGGFIAGFIWVIFCIIVFNIMELFKRDPST